MVQDLFMSRVIKLNLDEKTLSKIDEEDDIMAANADPEVIEKVKNLVEWKQFLVMSNY